MNPRSFGRRTSALRLEGASLSPGIGVGVAFRVEQKVAGYFRIAIDPEEVPQELERLERALERSRRQLSEVREKFEREVGGDRSYIIEAHQLILDDRELQEAIRVRISEGQQSAERAVREASERWLVAYRSLQDPFFRERGSDLQEVADRLIGNLTDLVSDFSAPATEDLVLVAPEITLSVLADYPLDHVKGLVVRHGGKTSHATIIARSYQIPVVSGISRLEESIRTGDLLIVDGAEGVVHVNPGPEELGGYRIRVREELDRHRRLTDDRSPCLTLDGRRVHLYCNTEVGTEVGAGMRLGAEGVGLFRSEYVYMRCKEGPVSEEDQFAVYRRLAEEVGDRPAVVRTLDIGSEKHPYFSELSGEPDNVLGLRGIRLSLRHPEIFRSQVRAVIRARKFGDLRILLPMVSCVDEVVAARAVIEEEWERLGVSGREGPLSVGVMLEVPAAVLSLESIAACADFLAVGTNDLIQYTLAASRTSERINHLSNPVHPAVFEGLHRIAEVSRRLARTAFVCGEMAAQPIFAYLLVGLGFQHLSVNPFAIPEIKGVLRRIRFEDARASVRELRTLQRMDEREDFLRRQLRSWEDAVPRGA